MPKARPIKMTEELKSAFKKGFHPLDNKEICWLWIGNFDSGYGRLSHKGRNYLAHRISWMIANKCEFLDEADGVVDHTCNNPPCVNPNHLCLLNSQKENISGEKNGQAKFSDELIVAIKDWHWRYGSSTVTLAKKFGVSQSHVSRILRGIYRNK